MKSSPRAGPTCSYACGTSPRPASCRSFLHTTIEWNIPGRADVTCVTGGPFCCPFWTARSSCAVSSVADQRHTLPVRLSLGGCSFQFGRTSILLPRPPHLAQTTRVRNHGTSVLKWKDPFPRSSSDRSSLPRSIKHPRLEHYNRDDDHAARDDEPVRIDWHQ